MAVLLSLSIVRTPGERAAKAIAISSAWLALRVRTLHDVTPKNMGPGESEGRRAARARALLLQHQNDEGAVYVDVAKVKNKDAYVAAAVAATTGKMQSETTPSLAF
ncbi:hypothetical protein MRX96_046242 [Rhipicephalus microplus]